MKHVSIKMNGHDLPYMRSFYEPYAKRTYDYLIYFI